MDLCASLLQSRLERSRQSTDRVMEWRRGVAENDLFVGNERREDGGEEDERQQVEYSHSGGGNWTSCRHLAVAGNNHESEPQPRVGQHRDHPYVSTASYTYLLSTPRMASSSKLNATLADPHEDWNPIPA